MKKKELSYAVVIYMGSRGWHLQHGHYPQHTKGRHVTMEILNRNRKWPLPCVFSACTHALSCLCVYRNSLTFMCPKIQVLLLLILYLLLHCWCPSPMVLYVISHHWFSVVTVDLLQLALICAVKIKCLWLFVSWLNRRGRRKQGKFWRLPSPLSPLYFCAQNSHLPQRRNRDRGKKRNECDRFSTCADL